MSCFLFIYIYIFLEGGWGGGLEVGGMKTLQSKQPLAGNEKVRIKFNSFSVSRR